MVSNPSEKGSAVSTKRHLVQKTRRLKHTQGKDDKYSRWVIKNEIEIK
jgi:hypothetical protein